MIRTCLRTSEAFWGRSGFDPTSGSGFHFHAHFSNVFSQTLKDKGSQDQSGINPLVEQGHKLTVDYRGIALYSGADFTKGLSLGAYRRPRCQSCLRAVVGYLSMGCGYQTTALCFTVQKPNMGFSGFVLGFPVNSITN